MEADLGMKHTSDLELSSGRVRVCWCNNRHVCVCGGGVKQYIKAMNLSPLF